MSKAHKALRCPVRRDLPLHSTKLRRPENFGFCDRMQEILPNLAKGKRMGVAPETFIKVSVERFCCHPERRRYRLALPNQIKTSR
jgi:hypothetical protein